MNNNSTNCANKGIECSVTNCANHCSPSEGNYCALKKITVGTHGTNAASTDCQSFVAKAK